MCFYPKISNPVTGFSIFSKKGVLFVTDESRILKKKKKLRIFLIFVQEKHPSYCNLKHDKHEAQFEFHHIWISYTVFHHAGASPPATTNAIQCIQATA